MSILAVLRLASGVDRARIAPVLDDEVRTLWELYTQGAGDGRSGPLPGVNADARRDGTWVEHPVERRNR